MDINKLSLEEKIGQRFIFGINDSNIDCIIELIKNAYIGGVVLYKKNYNSYQDMLNVIKRCKEANKKNKVPLFIAIDQEGGLVNRMPNEIHNLKSLYDVSMLDSKKIPKFAKVINKMLIDSGINMNFGPVLDIYNNSLSKALYKRCLYGTGSQVSKLASVYLDSIKDDKIISVIKHYPGHGVSKMDSHFIVPYAFNYKNVINKHMVPFDENKNKVDAVMVGHIIIRRLTGIWPASLTYKFLDKYLRKDDYNGLIMSDEVNMLRINPIYHFCYLNKILKSANDVILIKIKNLDEGYNIIKKYVSLLDKEMYNNRLDESVLRILAIKEKYGINDNSKIKGLDIDEINKEIDSINNGI